MQLTIRPAVAEEFPAVRRLLDEAFGQPDEGQLVEKLWSSSAYIPELSLIGLTENGEAVGYILFTHIHIRQGEQHYPSLALAPMAVWPDFQKMGIGEQLIRSGLEQAKQLGHESVIVLGHADYYPRFGFDRASRWGISCPLPVPDEVFMAQELVSGCLEGKNGQVLYSAPFGI